LHKVRDPGNGFHRDSSGAVFKISLLMLAVTYDGLWIQAISSQSLLSQNTRMDATPDTEAEIVDN
jgi:hypothetical protein